MNHRIQKNLILLTTVSSIILSGCVNKREFQTTALTSTQNTPQAKHFKRTKVWKNISKAKEDCVDCYATDISQNHGVKLTTLPSQKDISYTYDKAPIKQPVNTLDYKPYNDNKKEVFKYTPKLSTYNSSRDNYTIHVRAKKVLQVGAFRNYAGAKKTARKYDLLSNKYRVKIESGMKDNIPIHRVRIAGFNSRGEAKAFMQRYAINDAFLVRR